MIGRRKQTGVLFVDMLPQQLDVARAVLNKPHQRRGLAQRSGLDRCRHALDVQAAQLVLSLHDGHGAAPAREAVGFHDGKQVGLLLGMVATIGEGAAEVDHLQGGLLFQVLLRLSLLDDLLQAIQHLFDQPVFGHQDVRGLHGTSPGNAGVRMRAVAVSPTAWAGAPRAPHQPVAPSPRSPAPPRHPLGAPHQGNTVGEAAVTPDRVVGLSRSHEPGIRPRPSHIPHGASQDHWRGSASSRRHSNRPRPPHPGQGTVGALPAVAWVRTRRVRTLPAIHTPAWGSATRLPPRDTMSPLRPQTAVEGKPWKSIAPL